VFSTLTYVGQQGSEGFQGGSGNVYPVYTNPGFSVTVPAGTNFFQADGKHQPYQLTSQSASADQPIQPGKLAKGLF
jgi:hypothetical protein